MSETTPIRVEESATAQEIVPDLRAKMAEPLPVRIVAIGDVVLPAFAELEKNFFAKR